MKEDENKREPEFYGPINRSNYYRRHYARKWNGDEPSKDNREGPEVLIQNVIAEILRTVSADL